MNNIISCSLTNSENDMKNFPKLTEELTISIVKLYTPLGFAINSSPTLESSKYDHISMRFTMNNKNILFCSSKTTDDRPGHFVTFWTKDNQNKNRPYSLEDDIDVIVINCRYQDEKNNKLYHGHFYFDKNTLIEQGILATENTKGKMAMRVFPPWSQTISDNILKNAKEFKYETKPTNTFSSYAKVSQKWQLEKFVSLGTEIDKYRIKELLA